MLTLITSYYDSPNESRQNEIKYCLITNSNNKYIKSIYLLNDKIYNLNFIENENKNKIKQIIVDDDSKKRLKFKYAINFINEYLKGEICILANNDIYYDDTLSNLVNYNMENKFFALTRYENNKIFFKYSQDTWIFKSPLKIDTNQVDFCFGILGCDTRLSYIVYKNNIKVTNPSLTIKTHHKHASNFRTYNSNYRLLGKHLEIEQNYLNEDAKYEFMDNTYDTFYYTKIFILVLIYLIILFKNKF